MLLRRDLYRIITEEDEKELERVYRLALDLRCRLPAYLEEKWLICGRKYYPECHEMAHALARVAQITARDGEHAFLSSSTPPGEEHDFEATYTTILHSWNEFSVPSGRTFILDPLPVSGSSVMPVLLLAPHPAYWIPKDPLRLNALKQVEGERMQRRIANLVSAIEQIK